MKQLTSVQYKAPQKHIIGISYCSMIAFILFLFSQIVIAEVHDIPVDVAVFRSCEPEKSCFESYCQISCSMLQFEKKNDGYSAYYEICASLINSEGELVKNMCYEDTIKVNSYEDTNDGWHTQIVMFPFTVKPDNYDLLVEISDGEFQELAFTRKKVHIRSFDTLTLCLSDIQVAKEIVPQEQESEFSKNGRLVIQNPTRIFGITDDVIGVYYEIYNLSYNPKTPHEGFTVGYKLGDKEDNTVNLGEYKNTKPGSSAAISFNLSTADLLAGDYTLEVIVKDIDNNTQVSEKADFSIWRSPLALKYNDFDEVLKKLSYIAKPNVVKKLRKVSESERERALVDFWIERDPTPGTEQNELMQEFYSRITFANEHFGYSNLEGWKTDRGRIYIKHGKPDYLVRQNKVMGYGSREIWEYHQVNTVFLFLDKHGFGDFRLIQPHSYASMRGW